MNKTNMQKNIETKIVELAELYQQGEITTSDMQGMAQAIALEAKSPLSRTEWEAIGNRNDWGLIR